MVSRAARRPKILDDPSWHATFIETFAAEKLPSAVKPAVRGYATLPPGDACVMLLTDYADRGPHCR